MSVRETAEPVLKVLVPVLPGFDTLEPWLRRIDANRHYTNFGPLNGELERRLAALIKAEHAVTVSSGTAGLELALTAMGLEPGSHVLVPSLTFPATVTAIVRAGLTPVFADIDEAALVLTPAIASRITEDAEWPDLRAVLTVAIHGHVHDPARWDAFTAETGLPVLIDAAAVIGRQPIGQTTNAVFSLHATKPLAAGEGGVVATQDEGLACRVRSLSNFGFEKGRIRSAGTNAKLSEYHAAVALAALDRWPETLDCWMALYDAYVTSLEGLEPKLRLATSRDAPSNFCVRIGGGVDEPLVRALAHAGIETRRWYCPPVHSHPVFNTYPRTSNLSATDRVSEQILGLPFHLALGTSDIERVSDTLRALLTETPRYRLIS